MSVYTTQLRYPIENYLTRQGIEWANMSVRERCVKGIPYVFDFAFPIWDEGDRQRFQTNFLMYYYQQEIGSETFGLWKYQLETWLNINMPYYNQKMDLIIKSQEFEKLKDLYETESETYAGETNVTGTETRNDITNMNGSSNSESSDNTNNMQKYYEVPVSNISDITSHLNNATSNDGTQNGSTNVETTQTGEFDENIGRTDDKTEEHTLERKKKRELDRVVVLEHMLNMLQNVEKEIIDAMSVLFMGIY